MIVEDYVSFETAKLLKEKGFDEPCIWAYDPYAVSFSKNYCEPKNSELNEYEYSKPTLQRVMKWLREVHHIFIDVDWNDNYYFILITDMITKDYVKETNLPSEEFSTYEEACESAIKYCLENLI